MDTLEAEKLDALQPEPSMGEAVQGNIVAGASQASQSPSQMENKSRVTRKTGSIKDSTSVLTIANFVELRRTNMNRKEFQIDKSMEYGQSWLIDWDHVAEVKEDLLANPRDGRLQLLLWDDKGMAMPFRNLINVTGCFACPV